MSALLRSSPGHEWALALTLQVGFEEWRKLHGRGPLCCDNPDCPRWQQERNWFLQQVMFGGPLPSEDVPC